MLFSALSKPGLWLQNITTKEPTENQLEVSIKALETAFGDQQLKNYSGKKFIVKKEEYPAICDLFPKPKKKRISTYFAFLFFKMCKN